MRYLYLDILSKMTRWGLDSQPLIDATCMIVVRKCGVRDSSVGTFLNDRIGLATAELN